MQGRIAPVQPWLQKGNKGIGFNHKVAQASQTKQQSAKVNTQSAANRERAGAEQAVGERRKKLVAGIVEEELAGEDLPTKVKRHRQLMRQEDVDAKGRAISRMLSAAWSDPFDVPGGTAGDSNPLGRKHRLTALNPLLDDD